MSAAAADRVREIVTPEGVPVRFAVALGSAGVLAAYLATSGKERP